jgi:hypothetical protein
MTTPSRLAISIIGRPSPLSHSCSPHGIGSIRSSTTVACHNAFTSELSRGPSNSGAITTRSMSLHSFAPPTRSHGTREDQAMLSVGRLLRFVLRRYKWLQRMDQFGDIFLDHIPNPAGQNPEVLMYEPVPHRDDIPLWYLWVVLTILW